MHALRGLFPHVPFSLIEPDPEVFPRLPEEKRAACTDCGLCMKPCPADVDFPALSRAVFGHEPHALEAVGHFRYACVGHAVDPAVRNAGSSGALVTGLLLYLLREGLADRALVCGMDPDQPWLPRPFLARTPDEVLAGAQSKYTIVPQMQDLGLLARSKERTVIVGLPCHIHAYRKLEAAGGIREGSIVLTVGLACHSTLEREATRMLLHVNGIAPGDVARLEYRGGDTWPRGVQVTLRNGEVRRPHAEDIKASFNYLKIFYAPERCLTCIDYSAELADLAVMDPWIRDETGDHPYRDGWSLALVRSARAESIMDRAVKDGALGLERIDPALLPSQFDPPVRSKRIGAFLRMEQRRRKGLACPVYGLPAPDLPAKAKRREAVAGLPGRMARRWALLREIGMRLAFSRMGDAVMRRRTRWKIRKAAQRRAKQG